MPVDFYQRSYSESIRRLNSLGFQTCFPAFASSLNHNRLLYLAVSLASPLPIVTLMSTLCLPQISGDEFFADVAQDILLYVSRDLSDQVGCSLSWAKGSCLPCPGRWLGAALPSVPSQLSSLWGTAGSLAGLPAQQ